MFRNNPTIVVYIMRQSISLHRASKEGVAMPVPDTLVHNLEVRDAHKLVDALTVFLRPHKPKGQRALIVLDEGTVFMQAAMLQGKQDAEKIATDFEEKVPFNQADKQILRIPIKERLLMCGVNKAVYLTVARALEGMGCKTLGVVPAPVYGLKAGVKLKDEDIRGMLQDTKRRRLANLFTNA